MKPLVNPADTSISEVAQPAVMDDSNVKIDASNDPSLRVLKRGDLVRVAERRQPGSKNRDGGLGRIVRHIPVDIPPMDSNGNLTSNNAQHQKDDLNVHLVRHPFRYDIEWVLGGKVTNLTREELIHTTADAEGLTEDASTMRARRKRKPSSVMKEQDATLQSTSDTERRKKPRKKPTLAKKKAKSKLGSARKTVAGKKRKSGQDSKTQIKGNQQSSSNKKGKNYQVESEEEPTTSAALAMYERHRREFERMLTSLEKKDPFSFFSGLVPLEHDEQYGFDSDCVTGIESSGTEIVERTKESHCLPSNTKSVCFSSNPPFNFSIIRKRMEHGRYIIDHFRLEEEERNRWCNHVKKESIKPVEPSKPACKKRGRKLDPPNYQILHPKGIDWDTFRNDVLAMCDSAIERDQLESTDGDGPGTLGHTVKKIKDLMKNMYEKTGQRQISEMVAANAHHKFSLTMNSTKNNEAAIQGSWRTQAFPERKYERLSTNVVSAGLSELDERSAIYELQTSLPASFVGLAYKYDDIGQSEGWMKSVVDETGGRNTKSKKKKDEIEEEKRAAAALAADNGVVQAQVQAAMQTMLIIVQDRVMTDAGVLNDPELRSANWDAAAADEDPKLCSLSVARSSLLNSSGTSQYVTNIPNDTMEPSVDAQLVEQPVWGLDCYTRRTITLCLEPDFGSDIALEFVEKWLLPAVNACPVDIAHNLANATRILEDLHDEESLSPLNDIDGLDEIETGQWSHSLFGRALLEKIKTQGPPWLKTIARQLRLALEVMGPDFFRIHPKGHGSIVIRPGGIPANKLVTYYRGEVYPPWRWGEKMDAIEITQQKKDLRPNLPDFYNMALERPQIDPRGYGLLFVDASRKAGHGSSLSHSCAPTCEVRVAAVNGKLALAMTTIRDVEQGEELTFDYNAVTESLNEYEAALCLCGHGKCRGSFLHFATADCYQQVLSRNCPIAVRLASLVKGSMKKVMGEGDEKVLSRHGFGTAAFGAVSFSRHREQGMSLDSINNVPIWIRTYVADTLRYIEYERRALPIALLCNEFSTTNTSHSAKGSQSQECETQKDEEIETIKKSNLKKKSDKALQKPIPGSKPKPVFLYFADKKKDFFVSALRDQGVTDLTGLELQQNIKKIAGITWGALGDEKKQYWKDCALTEWEQNGGNKKAKLEEKRKLLLIAETNETKTSNIGGATPKGTKGPKTDQPSKKGKSKIEPVCPSKISFESADAEGIVAMEQRIQQLTQALSRVGRVLDRHRETTLDQDLSLDRSSVTSSYLRGCVRSPISIMPDDRVVRWIWSHKQGVVRTFLRVILADKCISPTIRTSIIAIKSKYVKLKAIGNPKGKEKDNRSMNPEARQLLTSALLEFRETLLNGLVSMEKEVEQFEQDKASWTAKIKRDAVRKRRAAQKEAKERTESKQKLKGDFPNCQEVDEVTFIVPTLLREMVDLVVKRSEMKDKKETKNITVANACMNGESQRGTEIINISSVVSSVLYGMVDTVVKRGTKKKVQKSKKENSSPPRLSPWLKYLDDHRGKLAATADLLLLYARTSTFFTTKPYISFESTAIEVYARELGNSVPRSAVDGVQKSRPISPQNEANQEDVDTPDSYLDKEATQKLKIARGTQNEKDCHNLIIEDRGSHPPEENVSGDQNAIVSTTKDDTGRSISTGDVISAHSLPGDTSDCLNSSATENENKLDNDGPDEANTTTESIIEMSQFTTGARFNVLRQGKTIYCTGVVVEVDSDDDIKRVKFHFPKMLKKFDEWVEAGTLRINPLAIRKESVRKEFVPKKAAKKFKKVNKNTNIEMEEEKMCQPDDIIANVVVKYEGDYVLSQLLQWYNGGIGQKSGMPDMLGCSLLPPISSCWSNTGTTDMKSKKDGNTHNTESTSYEGVVRPLLVDWFEDPHKRGNPWPEGIRNYFSLPNEDCRAENQSSGSITPFGSPILDFLVMGDDTNIQHVLFALKPRDETSEDMTASSKSTRKRKEKSTAERLQSSVDEGMPAQAVANWVQCENPDCLKWRKVPWHVDIDVLPEKFYCKDNLWNSNANTCDSLEDIWDEHDTQLNNRGVESKSVSQKKKAKSEYPVKEKSSGNGELKEQLNGTSLKGKKKKKTKTSTKIKGAPEKHDKKLVPTSFKESGNRCVDTLVHAAGGTKEPMKVVSGTCKPFLGGSNLLRKGAVNDLMISVVSPEDVFSASSSERTPRALSENIPPPPSFFSYLKR